jgi:7,8-dihydropterin-6-yl-methyl-4-(beta-D-ribofuranosyl)aminobenzene 5'-phosphate synthase
VNAMTRIIILADNTVTGIGVRGEHGLSFWIETDQHCMLFDTGQGLILEDNARALNVDLDAVDTVVLSHGHYDHTGGLSSVLRLTEGEVRIFAHPDVFLPKYSKKGPAVRDIWIPAAVRKALMDPRCKIITSRESLEVAPGIWQTGEIPRLHTEEAEEDGFFTDPAGVVRDQLQDDQALFMESKKGTIVLLGCAHAGPINTLDHIKHLTNDRPIFAVIGGMHLGSASEERLRWTIEELRRFDLHHLAAIHCTGIKASAALWHEFPDICRKWCAGSICEI